MQYEIQNMLQFSLTKLRWAFSSVYHSVLSGLHCSMAVFWFWHRQWQWSELYDLSQTRRSALLFLSMLLCSY